MNTRLDGIAQTMPMLMVDETRPVESRSAENWLERLVCIECRSARLYTSPISATNQNGVPQDGYLICADCSAVYTIRDYILDMAPRVGFDALTLAGWSNHAPPTPQLYEEVWRRRSLSLLTGEAFPVERELALMNEWVELQSGEVVVDLGTSTGLLARGLVNGGAQSAVVIAVDMARGMLKRARRYAEREGRKHIVYLRAAAERLPIRDQGVDAVVVGGSLNEIKTCSAPLEEAYRATRAGGRMFVMSLVKATRRRGRFAQQLVGASGIKFPTVDEFNAVAARAGWKLARQERYGVVLFSLLTK